MFVLSLCPPPPPPPPSLFQVLPLEKMVEGVRLTIAEGARVSGVELVSVKYNNLLHFLYKYISRQVGHERCVCLIGINRKRKRD